MFRNTNHPGSKRIIPEFIHVVESTSDEHGNVFQNNVTYTREEYDLKYPNNLPDLNLREQLEAGVPLKEVPTNGILDSIDSLDYDPSITNTINTLANE